MNAATSGAKSQPTSRAATANPPSPFQTASAQSSREHSKTVLYSRHPGGRNTDSLSGSYPDQSQVETPRHSGTQPTTSAFCHSQTSPDHDHEWSASPIASDHRHKSSACKCGPQRYRHAPPQKCPSQQSSTKTMSAASGTKPTSRSVSPPPTPKPTRRRRCHSRQYSSGRRRQRGCA